MAIYVSAPKQKSYIIPEGAFQAVCFNTWDIGIQKVTYLGVSKFRKQLVIGWEISEVNEQGKKYCVYKIYNQTLDKKSSLRKDLEAWRGKQFNDAELEAFDVERLVGTNCMITIVHNEKDGKIYSNVANVSKLMNGLEKMKQENIETFLPVFIEKLKAKQCMQEPEAEQKEPIYNENGDEEIPF